MKTKEEELKKVKALTEEELKEILGGYIEATTGGDEIDCTSELASGGTTTETGNHYIKLE